MITFIKLLFSKINSSIIFCFLSFLLGCIISSYITINIKNNEIDKLNQEISKKENEKNLQEKKFNDIIINIDNKTKEKEKENYERYQNTIKENQSIIDNLNTSNNGLRIKVRNLQTNQIKSSSLGDGTSSGTGFEAELDIANSRELVKISNRCDIYKEQLKALQDYINTYNENIK